MLSPKTQYNLKNAQDYFREHLCVGDYYSKAEYVAGAWRGKGAEMLGLSGAVTQAQFLALCENLHPQSGERLTQRTKTTRTPAGSGAEVANRRVFFDFTISPPKSVSVAALVGGDERITKAHAEAVSLAIGELEHFAATRVHEGAATSDRQTSNLVAALFQHETSRALDPHLHTHCILFNATHDAEEMRWKALQTFGLLSAQKFVENAYYHALTQRLHKLGYTIVNAARGDFEIAEIPSAVCERFSKRHREIDAKMQELLALHPEKGSQNIAALREHIAHKDRRKKQSDLPLTQLRSLWQEELQQSERFAIPGGSRDAAPIKISVEDAVDWAEEHLFERRSVVQEHEIWRQSLAYGRGGAFSLEDLRSETARRPYLRSSTGKVSLQDVLAREQRIVELARDGICRYGPFTPPESWARNDLAPDQQNAFQRIVSSTDFVTLFRGGAGTGKSYVLQRIQQVLHESRHTTLVLAPQRQQVLDLQRDGLSGTQTVSEFLQRGTMPDRAVVVVDEAGQIDSKQLLALLEMATQHQSRVILSGDTRQHGPVEASDALRAIERYACLIPAELEEIRRQDPLRAEAGEQRAEVTAYRAAVKAAAAGELDASFQILDAGGAIMECSPTEQNDHLVSNYLQKVALGETALVVSQTRSEVRNLNEAIRKALRATDALPGPEAQVTVLENVDLSKAQKVDQRFYPPGSIVLLAAKAPKSKAQRGNLVGVTSAGVVIETGGKVRLIRSSQLDRLSVYQPREISISAGDRLQLKANGRTADGQKLANGEVVAVRAIAENGSVYLEDGRTLPSDYRRFTRGYAVTSYGSQGKTVDHVLVADSAVRVATNAEQWYVSISRGRLSVRIFTSDKAQLAAAIRHRGHRELALDLTPTRTQRLPLRQKFIRGLRRGREFAKRVCLMVCRRKLEAGKRQMTSQHL